MYLDIKLIFDNGGGVTLQLGKNYAHYYPLASHAADDYKIFCKNGNTEGWEGHEEDAMQLNPTMEEIQNGGYRVFDEDGINELIDSWDEEQYINDGTVYGWANIDEFISALQ